MMLRTGEILQLYKGGAGRSKAGVGRESPDIRDGQPETGADPTGMASVARVCRAG